VVRVIEYMIEDRPGSGELFCLITTIADHEFAPAVELAATYAQRWESDCPSTRSKPTKQATTECSRPKPRNWSDKRSGRYC
jgi:hypothetical protein